ncbi:MAG: MBL fold metallo-hydrolase [Acidobacteriota bacterium]|nr:MBL fold metallo-hydrolase [Acidobacteriota bacterium]
MSLPRCRLPALAACLFALCVCALLASSTPASARRTPPAKFDVVKLAEGVYAAVRKDAPGFAVESNSVFIIGDDGVIVVDAQSNLAATRETLAALRKLTDKPVRYVVNTHWHDDHVVGNQVYAEAFPGVQFVAHAATRAYLPEKGAEARRKWHEGGLAGFVQQLRDTLKSGRNSKGEPLTEEQRESLASDIALGEGYLTVPADFRPVLPNLTLEEKLTLYQNERAVEILYLGRGHTSGDIVVHLPRERVVVAGDLLVWPVPFVGSDQSHVGDWGATLERLIALSPSVIVPGHGPVLRDDSYARRVARLMDSIKQQTAAAVARGETLAQVRRSVNLDEMCKEFAGESKVRNTLFSVYVVGPAVESAFNDAVSKR